MMIELIRGKFKVELEYIGEGICEDYNPDDPNDIKLMRFYISKRLQDDTWHELESCCTEFAESNGIAKQGAVLGIIMEEVCRPKGESIKRIAQRLSWINETWIGNDAAVKEAMRPIV